MFSVSINLCSIILEMTNEELVEYYGYKAADAGKFSPRTDIICPTGPLSGIIASNLGKTGEARAVNNTEAIPNIIGATNLNFMPLDQLSGPNAVYCTTLSCSAIFLKIFKYSLVF